MAEATPRPEKRGSQRGVGWYSFVAFLAACVILIGAIWVDNATGREESLPGYYRDTFIVTEGMHATATAEAAAEATAQAAPVVPTGTPTP